MDKPKELQILLADAQPVFRAGIAAILLRRHPNARFGEAASYLEAHEKLESQSWDILICDINLADRSGFELIQEARRLNLPIPTLVLSGNPVHSHGRRAVKSGAAAYLQKDTPAEELLTAIDHLLDGDRYITRRLAIVLADAADENNEKALHETLSEREMQVLLMLAEGKCIKKIATDLALSPKTISTYRGRVTDKLRLNSDAALVKYCMHQNLISGESDPASTHRWPPSGEARDIAQLL